jgi:anti-anti-sigma regulatory factor
MKVLSVKQASAVLRLSDLGPSNLPLLEQARPFILSTPFVVLDVDGIHFSSMLLGELVNLYVGFSNHWKGQRHGMALVHVPEVSRKVFQVSKLTDKIPLFDTVDEAVKSFGMGTHTAG